MGLIHEHCLRKLVDNTTVCATCRGPLVPRWKRVFYARQRCSCCLLIDRWLVAYVAVFVVALVFAFAFMWLYVAAI